MAGQGHDIVAELPQPWPRHDRPPSSQGETSQAGCQPNSGQTPIAWAVFVGCFTRSDNVLASG